MSLLANESNYNLKFIDHVARQRFDFLESLIEKDPTNEHPDSPRFQTWTFLLEQNKRSAFGNADHQQSRASNHSSKARKSP